MKKLKKSNIQKELTYKTCLLLTVFSILSFGFNSQNNLYAGELNLRSPLKYTASGIDLDTDIKKAEAVSIVVNTSDILQEFIVSGTVVDSEGIPLPGANVIEKETTNGTLTDFDGNFSLTVSGEDAVLVISFIGFVTKEIPIEGEEELTITLEQDSGALDEVVVVGYGAQRRATLTGAVSSISSEELTEVPVSNTANALAGKLPGLIAVQRSGEPGYNAADLSIRGLGSPLVVVDGVVGRDFSQLDPNSIESITVLKDAASTAVYGVSGGSGVLIVTTKDGVIGKPQLTYRANYGVQTVTEYPEFVNSAQYATLKNEASVNLGGEIIYSPEEIELFRAGTDPNYPNYDYYDHFIRDYAPETQQSISVNGGSESIQYFFLLGETKQETMWNVRGEDSDDVGFSRYNFRSNVTADITDNLEVAVGFEGRWERRDQLHQSSYLMSSWLQYQWPIEPPFNPDGTVAASNYGLVAYLDRDLTGYRLNDARRFQADINITYKIPFVEGLSARIMGARDIDYGNNKIWIKRYNTYQWDAETETSNQVGTRDVNSLRMETARNIRSNVQASLNYDRTFVDDHNVGALLLYEAQEVEGMSFWASRVGYVVPIDQLFAGPDEDKNNNGTAFDNGRESVVGRFTYNFQERYLFEYSFRYDGSARFPVDRRWGFFSGVSAGWRLSEEAFIADNINAIDDLKLRASWGQSGNDNTGNFQFLTGYNYPAYNYILGGNTVSMGMVASGVPNPNITWEESQMYNIGLDLSLWKRLLVIEADVFYRERTGMLAQRSLQIPSTFGASLPAENLNSDNSRGFELVLSHNNYIGDFSYQISPHIAWTRSKWDHYEQREFTSQYDSWRNNASGRWQNRYVALEAVGQFQSQEDIMSSPVQDGLGNSTLRPGDIKYEDYNNDGYITNEDRQVIGRGQSPEITYGMGMELDWKNFSLNMTWQGASNFNIVQQSYLTHPFSNGMNSFAYLMDRWHRADLTDPNSEWIPGRFPSTVNAGSPNNNQVSSFWVQDATYLRLKFLSLNYDLIDLIGENRGIQNLGISLSGQNLLTFTGLDFIDPEAPSGRLSYYPQQTVYTLGVNVTF